MKKLLSLLFFLFSLAIAMGQNNAKKDNFSINKTTKIILLRHAEKVLDGSNDPVLTPEGETRAERLLFLLSDMKIERIFSSPYIRTKMTVAKLAENKEIIIEDYNPKDANFAKYLLEKEEGKTAVVVGHSNSIPMLVNQLIGEEKFSALSEDVYSKLWILTFSNGVLIDCSLLNF